MGPLHIYIYNKRYRKLAHAVSLRRMRLLGSVRKTLLGSTRLLFKCCPASNYKQIFSIVLLKCVQFLTSCLLERDRPHAGLACGLIPPPFLKLSLIHLRITKLAHNACGGVPQSLVPRSLLDCLQVVEKSSHGNHLKR